MNSPAFFPKAFLFDMDGLLLDTERMFMSAFLELTRVMNIPDHSAEAFFCTLVGTSSKESTARLSEFLPAGTDLVDFDRRLRALHALNAQNGIPIKPFVVEVLQAIQSRGLPMAVVTSTHAASAHHHLKATELFQYFETICAGDEVSANKPDPAPYITAAQRLGLDPTDCVAFEDSDPGTTAAVRAGCKTYQIPDLRPVDKSLPDLGQVIVQDLGQAGQLIGLFDAALTSSEQL